MFITTDVLGLHSNSVQYNMYVITSVTWYLFCCSGPNHDSKCCEHTDNCTGEAKRIETGEEDNYSQVTTYWNKVRYASITCPSLSAPITCQSLSASITCPNLFVALWGQSYSGSSICVFVSHTTLRWGSYPLPLYVGCKHFWHSVLPLMRKFLPMICSSHYPGFYLYIELVTIFSIVWVI